MLKFPRVRSSHVFAIVAAGAVLGSVGIGMALASPAASSGYKACANAKHRLALENSHGNCPSNFERVTVGAAGSGGIISMTEYRPESSPNTSSTWEFLGSPPKENFVNKHTAAEITGTIDEATNGSGIDENLGICREKAGSGTVTPVSSVEPEFATAADSFFAQSVSGIVGNVVGKYFVGLCANDQTNVLNGEAEATVILTQTASGISGGPMAHASARAGQQK